MVYMRSAVATRRQFLTASTARARGCGADQHRGVGRTPIPLRLSLVRPIHLSLPIRRAGWGRDTNPDCECDANTNTGNGHDPRAGLSAEHGARL